MIRDNGQDGEVRAPKDKVSGFVQCVNTSTGEYLDSALLVNLLPINVTFHPDLQQSGCCVWQSQCF